MDKTTESASTSAKTEKEGVQIKGKDVIYLNAPEICFPENAPLNTDKRELYDILNELFQDGGEGGEWQPPEWWLEVPEPEDYEINLLVNVYAVGTAYNAPSKILIHVSTPEEFYVGQGPISVNWGDGTVDQYTGTASGQSWNYLEHNYAKTGQYIIKVTTTNQSCFLQRITENATLLIAKLGSKIIVNNGAGTSATQQAFYNHRALCWIKFDGTGGLPYAQGFEGDAALKRIDMTTPPAIIPRSTFSNTNYGGKFDFSAVIKIEKYGLQNTAFKKLILPKCTEIEESGIYASYSLEEVSAPLCTSAGNNAFSNCYKLSKAEFAEECVFGTNCFSSCFSLTPRPDGSII